MNPPRSPAFPATRWSIVAASQRENDPRASAALSDLCHDYWFPVYAHIRSQGRSQQDAEDLTQSFFQRIMVKRTLTHATPERGRFRTFLLTSVKHLLINQHQHAMAAKRAPERAIAFDAMAAEERLRAEPLDHRTPDQIFDRRYFQSLLASALAELRQEWEADGHAALFDALEPKLYGAELEKETRQQIAARFGMELAAIAARRMKLKAQLRDKITDKVAETLRQPTSADIKDELDALLMNQM